ncbi:penicillin acylase family protein [Cryomorphaceae bacterium 1068]|nr:penicillin acylase family protein [Cryomorphaceae bacterium 1068]
MGKLLKYFLLTALAVILIFWVFIQSHQPVLKGKLDIATLEAPVEVYFDEYGIPHIYADNAEDAYRAFGYVHAQDRLLQMDLMRRAGGGRLSEIIGPDMKEADMFFRTLGTNRQAVKDAAKFDELPEKVRSITVAYLEGVNSFIQTGKHPLEYKLLRVEPDTFTVEDVYCISAYMAYSFAYALRTDPLVQDISTSLGPDYLRSLDLAVTVDLLPVDTTRSDTLVTDSITPRPSLSMTRPHLPDMLPIPTLQGSNSWAIGPSRTLSGKVMLANDTHIKYSAPAVWYEAHIEYPGFGFYGNFIAGVPIALVGHSRNHAWGLTMFEDDDSDFFFERFSEPDSSYTDYRDSLNAPVRKFKETLSIKGEPDTSFTVYETVHGVLVNDILPIEQDRPVSMYWNYTNMDNQLLEAFYRLNRADNIAEFKKGVEMITTVGLNITYGDASGNIAHWSASKLLIRPDSVDGKHFAEGYSPNANYKGFYDFEDNPQVEEPFVGFVHSANQFHDSTSGILYPGYYAPNTRANRIEELMKLQTTATVESIQNMTLDNVSTTEADIAHEIARVIRRSNEVLTDLEEMALEEIEVWLGSHDLEDVEPTIYYKTLYYVLKNSMEDEMGDEKFQKLFKTHLLKRSYPALMVNDESPWWDDLQTVGLTETREIIFIKSFKKAVMEINEELGSDIATWQWQRVHFIEHPHPFSDISVLKQFFHIGPFPAPGGNETINNASFIFNGNGTYTAHYGPAMRIVIDFADIENATSILPTGNSGNVMSPYYSDQAEMYVRGEFRKMKMNKAEIKKSNNLLMLLPPEKEEE